MKKCSYCPTRTGLFEKMKRFFPKNPRPRRSILLNQEIGSDAITIFADDNKKYLSTELFEEIKEEEDFVSSKVKFVGYEEV